MCVQVIAAKTFPERICGTSESIFIVVTEEVCGALKIKYI